MATLREVINMSQEHLKWYKRLIMCFILALAGVVALGIWRPIWLTKSVGRDIGWTSLVISVLTLLVTAIIPVALYSLGRIGERTTHVLLDEQRQLLSAQRLDVLASQASQMSDPEDLRAILGEARALATGRSRTRIIEAYWRNPQVPLCGSVIALDGKGARITAQCLPAKLDGKATWTAIREVSDFLSKIREFEDISYITHRVADWILSQFLSNAGPGDMRIRELLSVSPDDMFAALLYPLDSYTFPVPARVNILAGVCDAYLDRIEYYPKGERLIAETAEKSNVNYNLSASLALSLATLLKNGKLYKLAVSGSEDCSIPPDSCAALVVAVSGAVSFCNSHLAMRALQHLPDMLINPSSLGTLRDQFEFGRAKYSQYRPELLDQYWPSISERTP